MMELGDRKRSLSLSFGDFNKDFLYVCVVFFPALLLELDYFKIQLCGVCGNLSELE